MDTIEYTIDSNSYTLISDVNSRVQNKSSYYIKLICSETTPPADDPDFYTLAPGEYFIFKKDSSEEGNLYAICKSEGQVSKVTVGPIPNGSDLPIDIEDVIVPYTQFLTINGDGVTTDLTVDGSTTPVEAYVPARNDGNFYITVLSVFIADSNATSLNRFGAIDNGLTNGIEFYFESTLGNFTLGNAKTNLDILRLSWITPGTGSNNTAFEINDINTDNDNGYLFSIDLSKMSPIGQGIRLRKDSADRLGLRINDDISSLNAFSIQAIGYIELLD